MPSLSGLGSSGRSAVTVRHMKLIETDSLKLVPVDIEATNQNGLLVTFHRLFLSGATICATERTGRQALMARYLGWFKGPFIVLS